MPGIVINTEWVDEFESEVEEILVTLGLDPTTTMVTDEAELTDFRHDLDGDSRPDRLVVAAFGIEARMQDRLFEVARRLRDSRSKASIH